MFEEYEHPTKYWNFKIYCKQSTSVIQVENWFDGEITDKGKMYSAGRQAIRELNSFWFDVIGKPRLPHSITSIIDAISVSK